MGVLVVLVSLVPGCTQGSPLVKTTPSAPTTVTAGPSATVSVQAISTALTEMTSPAEIAAQIVRAERKIRSDQTPNDQLKILGRIQQLAYRKIVSTPDLLPSVMHRLPDDLKAIAQKHFDAGTELRALTKPVEKVPDWTIVPPPPAGELRGYYDEAEKTFGISWTYLAAVHLVETRMGRIRGDSSAGAKGPMQFLPSTWAKYGRGDIEDAHDAIMAAARYLKAAGAPQDMAAALHAYNHSDHYVRAVTIYAEQMMAEARTFLGYHEWQVYVRTTFGDVLLPDGT